MELWAIYVMSNSMLRLQSHDHMSMHRAALCAPPAELHKRYPRSTRSETFIKHVVRDSLQAPRRAGLSLL